MGSTYIQGFFETGLDLESILKIHMENNCFPRISTIFIESFKEAINLVADEKYQQKVKLPNGRYMSALEIVENGFLWDFVEHIRDKSV